MSVAMTIELDEVLKARLDREAEQLGISVDELLKEFIADGLALHEDEIPDDLMAALRRGEEQIQGGRGIPHETVKEWILSVGTENEAPRPK
jgi:predicted transcriptional regulator